MEELKKPDIGEIVANHHGATLGFSRHYLTLYSMVLGVEAKNVLEIGCGFSTPTILKALESTGGNLITCDIRPIEKTGNSPSLLDRYKKTWTYLRGDSRKTIPGIKGTTFDIVLHDGAHDWWILYRDLKNILPRIKRNGLLLIHDTEHTAFHLKPVIRFALALYRHEILTLPYGYGLTMVRILGNKRNGSVTLTWEKNRKN